MFEIRCKETGDRITEFDTYAEAEKTLEYYAHIDMLEDLPDGETKLRDTDPYKDFYEIVEVTD